MKMQIFNYLIYIYNFCFDRARDLISFLLDQKLKTYNENVKQKLKTSHNHSCGCKKLIFRHPAVKVNTD